MENNHNPSIGKAEIGRPEAKLLLGFFAGICSAIFPRLIVLLNMSNVSGDIIASNVIVFEWSYIMYALIFSIIVGIVVMILEWNVVSTPGKTFMMALSVPALISGGFNTNSAIDLYRDNQSSLRAEEQIQRENPIPTIGTPVAGQSIKPLAIMDNEKPKNKSISFPLPGVTKAYAADSLGKSSKFLAFKVRQQHYFIVLDRASNRQEAIERAEGLRSDIPQAQAIQVGNQYFVILGDTKLPRNEALRRADELRRQHSTLNVELLPLQDP